MGRPFRAVLTRRGGVLRRIARIALIALVVHHGLLYAAQRRMLFPGAWMTLPDAVVPEDVERVSIESEVGSAVAWFRSAKAATKAAAGGQPAPLIVYAHGNAERAIDFPWWSEPYTSAGFHVLVLEYRGFDGTDGSPSEAGIVKDALGLIESVVARPDVDGGRVVYHGRSLGGGVAASLARLRKPSGLILESSFSSVASMARDMLAPSYLIRDPFDIEHVLEREYDGPTLILHGGADDVIPVEEARRNFAAAGEDRARLIVQDRHTHLDSWMIVEPEILVEFVRGVLD